MKMVFFLFFTLGFSTVFADDLLSILQSSNSESLVQEVSELQVTLRDILKTPTAEQNIFLDFVGKNQFEKALLQWNSAFSGTEFVDGSAGQALYSYLLLKNGLPIVAVEALFKVGEASKIPKVLREVIKLEIPSHHNVWSRVQVEWKKEWRDFFDQDIEVILMSRSDLDLKKQQEIYELLKKSKLQTVTRGKLEWKMALSLAVNEDASAAAKVLAHLIKENRDLISSDLIHITAARLLYERGFLDAAISYYQKIAKSSEYWFVAQEEIAWAYMRKGQPQDTLAIAKSQMYPDFAPHVGAELVFLKALAHLKLCDFTEVAKTLLDYRLRYYERAKSLLEVEKLGVTPASEKLVELMKGGKRIQLLSLGSDAKRLPRFLTRDEHLMDLIGTYSDIEKESAVAASLYSRSLSEGTAEVGFQAFLEQLKTASERRMQVAKNAIYSLIKQRASEEIAEIHSVLQKMHIVEAELIQQSALVDRVTASAKSSSDDFKKGSTEQRTDNSLVFPFEGETWFDELGHYKIDVDKACKNKKVSRK